MNRGFFTITWYFILHAGTIDALKQLEAEIALAKTELSNASSGSTGRDAAADK